MPVLTSSSFCLCLTSGVRCCQLTVTIHKHLWAIYFFLQPICNHNMQSFFLINLYKTFYFHVIMTIAINFFVSLAILNCWCWCIQTEVLPTIKTRELKHVQRESNTAGSLWSFEPWTLWGQIVVTCYETRIFIWNV